MSSHIRVIGIMSFRLSNSVYVNIQVLIITFLTAPIYLTWPFIIQKCMKTKHTWMSYVSQTIWISVIKLIYILLFCQSKVFLSHSDHTIFLYCLLT